MRDERPGGYAWGQLVCATRHSRRVLPALPLLEPTETLAVSTFVTALQHQKWLFLVLDVFLFSVFLFLFFAHV